jgi:hypothetical protein
MTPKEKAKELVEAMAFSCRECDYEAKAKQSALIAVAEILDTWLEFSTDRIFWQEDDSPYTSLEARQYYLQVKQEIEKL